MSSRCDHCKKKVGIMGLTCSQCTMKFCTSHIQYELHNCPHDYKGVAKEMLKKQLEEAGKLGTKLIKIEDN